jgi:hypothetical protein
MTIPLSCYPNAASVLAYHALGVVNTTGSNPWTHTLTALQYPTVALPAVHTQMVRDTTNIKMAGATVNSITFDFPLDGEGTIEAEFFGKFHNEFAAATPVSTFTDFGAEVDTMMLRDARFYIDDSPTTVQDLQGFSFTFNNNLIRKWYAGRNVVTRSLGSPTSAKKLWFPAENKAQAAPDITYSVTFGNTNDAEEVAMWYAQIEKFEFNIVGLGTDELTFILYNAVHTDGGPDALSARDDITSNYEGGVFYSEADSKDLEIIAVTNQATLA